MKKNLLIAFLIIIILVEVIIIVLNIDDNNLNKQTTKGNKSKKIKENVNCEIYIEEKDEIPYITVDGFDDVNSEINNFYNANSDVSYTYHYYKNILIIILSSSKNNGYEGIVNSKAYYLDLDKKEMKNAKEVYEMFARSDFTTACSESATKEECNIDYYEDSLIIIPVGNYLYVESTDMGTFRPFYTAIK